MAKYTPIDPDQLHQFNQKLRQAGLDSELAQKVLASKDNKVANQIIALLENRSQGHEKSPDSPETDVETQTPHRVSTPEISRRRESLILGDITDVPEEKLIEILKKVLALTNSGELLWEKQKKAKYFLHLDSSFYMRTNHFSTELAGQHIEIGIGYWNYSRIIAINEYPVQISKKLRGLVKKESIQLIDQILKICKKQCENRQRTEARTAFERLSG